MKSETRNPKVRKSACILAGMVAIAGLIALLRPEVPMRTHGGPPTKRAQKSESHEQVDRATSIAEEAPPPAAPGPTAEQPSADEKKVIVCGTVRWASGDFVNPAWVWLEGKHAPVYCDSNSNGEYIFYGAREGRAELVALTAHGTLWTAREVILVQGENRFDLQLPAEGTLELTFRDRLCRPVQGAEVAIDQPSRKLVPSIVGGRGTMGSDGTQSDENGILRLQHLEPVNRLSTGFDDQGGVAYKIYCYAPGYQDVEVSVEVFPGANFNTVVFRELPASWIISGVVLDSLGRRVSGAEVNWNYSGTPPLQSSISSGEDGTFLLHVDPERLTYDGDGHPLDNVSLRATAEGMAETYVDLALPLDRSVIEGLEIRLDPGVIAYGRVLDEGGAPIARAPVSIVRIEGSSARTGITKTFSGEDGSFEARLASGFQYRFTAERGGIDRFGKLGMIIATIPGDLVELRLLPEPSATDPDEDADRR